MRLWNDEWAEGFCRKFSFVAIYGMISRHDQRCIIRERDDGDQLQGSPFPTGYHPHGRALVCGVALELPSCRRTLGGARGADRPCDHPALGREL